MVSDAWIEAKNQASQSPLASDLLLSACTSWINFRNLHLKFLCSLEIPKSILITCPPFPQGLCPFMIECRDEMLKEYLCV